MIDMTAGVHYFKAAEQRYKMHSKIRETAFWAVMAMVFAFAIISFSANETRAERAARGIMADEFADGQVTMWRNDIGSSVERDEDQPSPGSSYSCHFRSGAGANDIRMVFSFPVEEDTWYYASTWVKTKQLVNTENPQDPIGAGICAGDGNLSATLLGTHEWTQVMVPFYSGKANTVDVSLFQGYYSNTCEGESWAAPPVIRKAEPGSDGRLPHWNILFVILKNMDAEYWDEEHEEQISCHSVLSGEEIEIINRGILETQDALNEYGEGLFEATAFTVVLEEPVKEFRYLDDYKYTFTSDQAGEYLKRSQIDLSFFDHVVFIACMENVPSANVFGLGGTAIENKIKYSFVEFDNHSDINSWDSAEVRSAIFVHEFLHGIEYSCKYEYGLDIPELHDAELYGYTREREWEQWYRDYIRCHVENADREFKGIPREAWSLLPHLFSARSEEGE